MKKIISGLLIFASFLGGMSAFTSCKDSDDDQFAEMQREDYRLMQQIQELSQALDEAKQQYTAQLNQAISDLEGRIASGYCTKAEYDALAQRVAALEAKVCQCGDLQGKLDALETAILNEVGTTYATKDELNDAIENLLNNNNQALEDAINNLLGSEASSLYETIVNIVKSEGGESYDDTELKAELEKILKTLGYTINEDGTTTPPTWAPTPEEGAAALADAINQANWVSANKTAIENLITTLGNLDPSKLLTKEEAAGTYLTKEDFDEYVASLKDDLEEFVKIYNQVANTLGMTEFESLEALLTDYATWRNEITAKVAANAEAIQALQNKYNLVNNRLDTMITSIVAEGSENPVFGTFAAPVGMASNVLMAYYGEMSNSRAEFPYAGTLYEYDGTQVLTSADIQMLGVTPKVYEGTVVPGEDNNYVGNAGTLYLTVNPGNVDMTGKTVTLVNSQNEKSSVAITTPVKSDKVLTFGYTRAAEDVSLYEAAATITPENVAACCVNVEPGLKSAALDFVRNYTSASTLAGLMSKVYDQFNGILPRLAVKAEWEYTTSNWDDASASWVDATETGIVRSGLDVAATSFKPLSFKSLEGKTFSRRLPIISELNIDWESFVPEIKAIEIDEINLEDVKLNIQIDNVELSADAITVTLSGDVEYNTWKQDTEDEDDDGDTTDLVETTETMTVELTGDVTLDDFVDKMESQLNDQLGGIGDEINDEFARIMSDLQGTINDMLSGVETQINDIINDLVDDLIDNIDRETGKYFDKFNSFIKKYNSIANRINRVIENPSHYMQVTMLYKNNNGGFSFLSTNENAPSKFTLNGGNAIMLYPTTYNAEIITPAFKKVVGICDVIDLNTGASAQGGDAGAKAALEKANKDGYNMDQIIEGSYLRVATGELTPGYKYVVAYSALDYRGFTSTNKYYFQVK